MRTRLGVGLSTSFLLVVSLLTAAPIMARDSADTPAVRDEAAVAPMLAADVQGLKEKAHGDERVTVVIKLQGASLSRASQDMVIAELKRQAIQRQEVLLDFLHREGAVVLNTFWLTNAVLAEVPVNHLDAIASLPGVEMLFENFKVTVPEPAQLELLDVRPDLYVGDVTWGLDKIGAPEVWDMGISGSGVRVAVLDTGVDMTHPDLAGRMWTDDVTDPTYPAGWIEFDAHGNVVPSEPYDSQWHGTHVSGTVLGGDASGYSIGVAPGAYLMHGLVLPGGRGTWAQVIAGMEWAVAPFDRYNNPTGEPADVLNMSLGAEGQWEAMIDPVENARAAGVVVIASIGNKGEGTSGSPGNVYKCFGIGATDQHDYVATFSGGEVIAWPASHPQPYTKPDFSAPGVGVLSALALDYMPPYGWAWASGTSMAAPHVAGVVALMLEANPALTVDDIYDILKNTSVWYDRYYDDKPCTRYGWGRIDAFEAVSAAAPLSGIEGFIRDAATQCPLEGATIVIEETEEVTYTDDSGYYCFHLEPGEYTVTANLFGYYGDTAEDVEVVAGAITSRYFVLEPMPDLIISEKYQEWVGFEERAYTINYTVKNLGGLAAGTSTTSVKIDGIEVETDPVPSLGPGDSHSSTFGPFTMSGDFDTILVCADRDGDVEESDETNNCLENTWGTLISGLTAAVNCDTLADVTITIYDNGEIIDTIESDGDGDYSLAPHISEAGVYRVVASKDGFRDESRSVTIEPGHQYDIDFRGDHGLIPDDPDLFYVLDCIDLWLYPPGEECGLTLFRVLDVIDAWLYPIIESE